MFQKLKQKATMAKAVGGALVLSAVTSPAFAGDAADIIAKVDGAMTSGAAIASAVVLGLFAIWAIKLLWRAK